MKSNLLGSMFNLLFPPEYSAADIALVAALERNNAASRDVVERASNIERAMLNIRQSTEGMFA